MKYTYDEIDKMEKEFVTASKRVLKLFRESEGAPDHKPVDCPRCEEETLHYNCNWFGNKHLRLKCTSCGWGAMQ